ncbi:SMP-30/gluconolactonase/LRE family protein [Edaphobacter bradus]|uniref:SMP-30/gluconolactonase/LRE family protein n=1 Tax=Edaphobacter bradus TaxID=2259016 RepID=UPI0021DFE7D3|nr:SMP-30/gluconolactonase/LRE family protein [Edaphobacter bradus]
MEPSRTLSPRVHVLGLLLWIVAAADGSALAAKSSFIGSLNTVTTLSTTVPANGDVNPYGVAMVPVSKGSLVQGRFLISNFNNGSNLQGTGTTIVQIAPDGTFSLFAKIDASKVSCPGGVGLTTALVALRSGFVIVGSLPTTDGTSATIGSGCLLVLDSTGNVVETFSGNHINGPWDMTAVDGGDLVALFVTNVLNGTVAANGKVVDGGTVVRLLLSISEGEAPELLDSTVVADKFPERTDPAALVIGPTGVAFDGDTGILYVADSLDNRIAAVPDALSRSSASNRGQTVSQGRALNDPLGLAFTPNHHLVAANGNDGNLVEVDPQNGIQVAVVLVDNTGGPPPGAGALFGLAADSDGVYFVDDASNTFNLLH